MAELCLAQFWIPAPDAFQLVDSATGKTQAAATHLADGQTTGGNNRADSQCGLVTHPATRMFVNDQRARCDRIMQVKLIAASRHRQGECGRFGVVHPLKIDRHRPRRHLIIGDGAVDKALHKAADLLITQHTTIAFFDNQIDWVHLQRSFLGESMSWLGE